MNPINTVTFKDAALGAVGRTVVNWANGESLKELLELRNGLIQLPVRGIARWDTAKPTLTNGPLWVRFLTLEARSRSSLVFGDRCGSVSCNRPVYDVVD
jgi:hypothetical protein